MTAQRESVIDRTMGKRVSNECKTNVRETEEVGGSDEDNYKDAGKE